MIFPFPPKRTNKGLSYAFLHVMGNKFPISYTCQIPQMWAPYQISCALLFNIYIFFFLLLPVSK